jgi:hypothetical protein
VPTSRKYRRTSGCRATGPGHGFVAGEGKCECRLVAKQAEEDEAIVVDQVTRQVSLQQDRLQRITTDEASILPDGDKPAFRALDRPGQPVPILASLPASLDEGAGEYIGILHPDIPIQSEVGQCTGIAGDAISGPRSS